MRLCIGRGFTVCIFENVTLFANMQGALLVSMVPLFIHCMEITVNFLIRLNGDDPRILLELSL